MTRSLPTTRRWIERAVIGLNLCPFARNPFIDERICYRVSGARTEDALVADLGVELERLHAADPSRIETTLLIHPQRAGGLPRLQRLPGHCRSDARSARTDRSTFRSRVFTYFISSRARSPTTSRTARIDRRIRCCICCVRPASIARSRAMPDTASIYEANIATLERLGAEGWRRLWLKA